MKIFLLGWLHLMLIPVMAQDNPAYAVSMIPDHLKNDAYSVTRIERSDVQIASPRAYSYTLFKAVTILDERSEEKNVVAFYDKYSRSSIQYIRIYDQKGKHLRSIKKSEINDVAAYDGISLLHDQRLKWADAPGGRLPYTIEYEVKMDFKETMFFHHWTPASFHHSIQYAEYILQKPASMTMDWRVLNASFEEKKSVADGMESFTWTLSGIPAVPQEANSPGPFELLPVLVLLPHQFEVEAYTGSMADWKSYGQFIYDINKDQHHLSPEMKEQVRQLTIHCGSDKEKIDTLYQWLQKNMRYVSIQLGIGGWKAFDAPYVEKNGFGDCKALSTFMKGMLETAGIDSWQTVIFWDEQSSFMPDDFVVLYFNHMMLYVPSEDMWLECTSNNLPAGKIDRDEENKEVLLITPEGGKKATTPASLPSHNSHHIKDTIHFSKNGFEVYGQQQFTGNLQREIRDLFFHEPVHKQRESFLDASPYSVDKLNVLHIEVDNKAYESEMRYHATLAQYGSASGDRLFIPVNFYHENEVDCGGKARRKLEFISNHAYTLTREFYIHIPDGYEIEFLPEPQHLEFRGNEYAVALLDVGSHIQISHTIIQRPLKLKASEFNQLCEHQEKMRLSDNRNIVLKKKKT